MLKKYRDKLLETIRKKFEEWFNQTNKVEQAEVYRFLHSITGSAKTIGLDEISVISRKLMESIDEKSLKKWAVPELQLFLMELVSYCYECELEEIQEASDERLITGDEPLVLIIDDELTMLAYLKEELEKKGWLVLAVPDPEKAISFFYDFNPDCVIIDVHMKERNGFEVLSFFKHKVKEQFMPTIMMSTKDEKEIRLKSYHMGADDFIPKSLDIEEFIVRVERQIERKALFDKLLLVDELTMVYNRKFLEQAYEEQLSEFRRRNEPFCIVVLDLDHFKKVNDTHGHLIGDEVLKKFATYLNSNSRNSDIVVRYGGEEFVMLLPRIKKEDAKTLMDRLREGFSKEEFHGDGKFYVTFSTGIVEVTDDTQPLSAYLELADTALYEAKNNGRNQVRMINNIKENSLPKKLITVAIVDDDPIIRTIVSEVMNQFATAENFEVDILSFKDGTEFLKGNHFESERPCLVILDGVMPEMDGFEVLKHIRSSKHAGKYTIIMLTARRSEEAISQALQLGADDYITKPFSIPVLEARVKRLIQRMKK